MFGIRIVNETNNSFQYYVHAIVPGRNDWHRCHEIEYLRISVISFLKPITACLLTIHDQLFEMLESHVRVNTIQANKQNSKSTIFLFKLISFWHFRIACCTHSKSYASFVEFNRGWLKEWVRTGSIEVRTKNTKTISTLSFCFEIFFSPEPNHLTTSISNASTIDAGISWPTTRPFFTKSGLG